MLRRLFTLASALSLLLCFTAVLLPTLAPRGGRGFRWADHDWWLDKSFMMVNWYDFIPNPPRVALATSRPAPVKLFPGVSIGFDRTDESGGYMDHRFLRFDYPVVAGLSFALPTIFVIDSWRRRRDRWRTGTCMRCGYDLRASKNRCPECGTSIQSTAVPAENPTITN